MDSQSEVFPYPSLHAVVPENAGTDTMADMPPMYSRPIIPRKKAHALTDPEIDRMIGEYTAGMVRSRWQFWAPWFALTMGLSAQEFARLHSDDLVSRDGHWWLSVRRLTTEPRHMWRARDLPLSQALLALGAVKWMQSASPNGDSVPMFPDISFQRAVGMRVTEWGLAWGNFRWTGPQPAPGLSDLRATFEARLRQLDGSERWLHRMVGRRPPAGASPAGEPADLDAELLGTVSRVRFPMPKP
ncbi:MAG: hypothetical protein AAGC76_05345 [Luteibacter sp.]|uniref:hypothetical protein n=1 Tax=Luteibacter sp. TaxID=1886636 RepID=UPI002808E3F8|nr:hypothetical protein [Luteibacter sp.]MDQ7995262.1 hypothetical protein [Luteibacter sp.]